MPKPGPDKTLCLAQRSNQPPGTLCQRVAGHGTDHLGVGKCSRHGGATRNHQRSAEKELARRECLTLGVPIEIHPAESLLRACFQAEGDKEFYRALVAELPTHPGEDVYHPPEADQEHGYWEHGYWERGQPGVYGRTYHVSGLPTGEAKPHVLVQLYEDALDRVVSFTTAALKVGLDAKRVELAQREGAEIAESFRQFAVALGHDPAAPEVREAFRAQLTLIAGGRAA